MPSFHQKHFIACIALFAFTWCSASDIPVTNSIETSEVSSQDIVQENKAITLEEVERIIATKNLIILAAHLGVSNATAQKIIAAQIPNATFTAGAEQFPVAHPTRYVGKDNFDSGAQNTYTLRVDQPIELGGKRNRRVAQSIRQIQVSEFQLADAVRQQLVQGRQDFVAALLSHANGELAHEQLAVVDQEEASLTKQVQAGNLPENDLVKFQISRVDAEKNVRTSELAFRQALSDLQLLVNYERNQKTDNFKTLAGDLTTPLPDDPGLDVLESQAVHRPDVEASSASVEVAKSGLEIARSLRYPDPTVGAEYQRVGGDNTVGLVLSVPLPWYSNHRGDISLAESQLHQAELQYRQLLRQAQSDIEKSYAALQTSRSIISLYGESMIEKAHTSLLRMESAYLHGAASFVDLGEARRAYSQIKAASNQAHADGWAAYYQLLGVSHND